MRKSILPPRVNNFDIIPNLLRELIVIEVIKTIMICDCFASAKPFLVHHWVLPNQSSTGLDDDYSAFRCETRQACLVLLRISLLGHRPLSRIDLKLRELQCGNTFFHFLRSFSILACHLACQLVDRTAPSASRRSSVRHSSEQMEVQCVKVVIGVVLGELHVVRVVPVVVCDDAVVRRTLVLTALYRSHCFHRIHCT